MTASKTGYTKRHYVELWHGKKKLAPRVSLLVDEHEESSFLDPQDSKKSGIQRRYPQGILKICFQRRCPEELPHDANYSLEASIVSSPPTSCLPVLYWSKYAGLGERRGIRKTEAWKSASYSMNFEKPMAIPVDTVFLKKIF